MPTARQSVASALLLLAPAAGIAQATPRPACGKVAALPTGGNPAPPVALAEVRDDAGRLLAVTDALGAFCLPAGSTATGGSVLARGYLAASWTPPPSEEFWAGTSWVVTLEPTPRPLAKPESIEVTAYRTPIAELDSPASTRILDAAALGRAAGVTLDAKLRTVAGFELFRRTSALVANPTTQGISLRGLGSTAASRTLVISDDVPLNDPFGGWIHWDEVPELAIHAVEVVRGGASDLYGSTAIGGGGNVMTGHPPTGAHAAPSLTLEGGYGGEETTEDGLLATASRGPYGVLGAGELTATDGYTLVAPALRGPVDTPSNVHAESALAEADRRIGAPGSLSPWAGRVFLRGNVLNENRHNGTPLQLNATRLWRYAAGAELGRISGRVFGSNEHYLQTFSAIAPGRATERLTRTGEDPADELGAAGRWTQPFRADGLVVVGADLRDVRAEDVSFAPANGPVTSTTARQRLTGVYGELLATPHLWTLSGSARLDHFTNGDAAQFAPGEALREPSLSETVLDPRLGVSRRLLPWLAAHASGFRAYRAPTVNELYRTGQVGQQTTYANPSLLSERATGWEAGLASVRSTSELQGSWFWTQINRPITALTLATTPTATTLMRENLGQIESRGVSLDGSVHPTVTFPLQTRLSLQGGYQFAIATVTSFAREPQLVGKWIPQVPRQMGTLQANWSGERLGLLSLQASAAGRQYDDDQNRYELHPFFRMDVYASHAVGHRIEAFAAVENLLDRSIDAGRTPVQTLATPRLARFGLRVRIGG